MGCGWWYLLIKMFSLCGGSPACWYRHKWRVSHSIGFILEGPGLASRMKCRVRVISVGKLSNFLWFYSYLLLSPLGYTVSSVFIQKLSLGSSRSSLVFSRMENLVSRSKLWSGEVTKCL